MTVPVRIVAAALALQACTLVPPGPIEDFMSIIDPGGSQPRAAVVLVPSCAGSGANVSFAAERLANEGYVVLTLDYPLAYARRGGCSPARAADIAGDIVRATHRLRLVPDVDSGRVHLVGWAEGGAGIMRVVGDGALADEAGARSVATYYPTCASISGTWRVHVPLLLLLGDPGAGSPGTTRDCIEMAGNAEGSGMVLAIRYGGEPFEFDGPRAAGANPHLREAALQDVRLFFSEPATISTRPNPAR